MGKEILVAITVLNFLVIMVQVVTLVLLNLTSGASVQIRGIYL